MYEILFFLVFCQLLQCVRSSNVSTRCQKYNGFFVNDNSIATILKRTFYLSYVRQKYFSKSLSYEFELFQKDKEEYFDMYFPNPVVFWTLATTILAAFVSKRVISLVIFMYFFTGNGKNIFLISSEE